MNAPDAMEAFAAEWAQAFNAHDLERILSHYADDVVLVSPIAIERLGVTDGTVRGKAALRAYFARALGPGSPLHFTLRRCYRGVGSVVVEFERLDGRRGAEMLVLDADGRVIRVVAHYADIGSQEGLNA